MGEVTISGAEKFEADRLRARLDVLRDRATYPRVMDVRQRGLMVGIELRTRARTYLEALIGQGVLALPAGPTVLRLLPPLVIDTEKLDLVVAALADVLAQ